MNERRKKDYVRLKKEWTTHMPMIIKVMLNSDGPVCEVGGGPFSTPILHWLCSIQNRKLVTYENHPEYYEFCKRFQSGGHKIIFVNNWDDMDFKRHWGVVFIDHHPPQRRSVDMINFKDTADYLIMHDTEDPKGYNWENAWPHFKNRYDWKGCKPWTSVVSNFKSLDFLK